MTTTGTRHMSIAIDLPPVVGLAVRAFDPSRDFPLAAAVIGESHAADGVEYVPSAEQLRLEWSAAPGSDPERDVIVAEVEGRAVAICRTVVREGIDSVTHRLLLIVRPEVRRRGIGGALLTWAEAHARQVVAEGLTPATDKPRFHGTWLETDVPGAMEFASRHGYEAVRRFMTMVRDLREPIVDVPLPAGLEVRPVRAEDHRRIWDADVEAFLDHFDASIRSEGDYDAFFNDPHLDPSLWQVAWDGDEVAGSVINAIPSDENERLGISRGWLEHVSVRRPWRGRGLAGALVVRSLLVLRERGLEQACLGVDQANPTGAVGVYERAGFVRHRSAAALRKPF